MIDRFRSTLLSTALLYNVAASVAAGAAPDPFAGTVHMLTGA